MPKGYSPSRNNWTNAERCAVEEGIADGLPLAAIAKRIGRSTTAVEVYCKRNLRRRLRRPYSACATARLLGIGDGKTVERWARFGWLCATRHVRAGGGRRLAITHDALLTFIEDERYWHVWSPERIRERRLREYASEQRAAVGALGRWLTPGEAARRLGVGHAAVNDYIRRALLPARRWGNWRIRESDLAAFVSLCERSKRGIPAVRFTPTEDARLIAMRAGGATWTAIAAALGRSIGSVYGRWGRLAGRRRSLWQYEAPA